MHFCLPYVFVCLYVKVVQKVLNLTQKEEPYLNIFVVATHHHLYN